MRLPRHVHQDLIFDASSAVLRRFLPLREVSTRLIKAMLLLQR